MTDKQTGPESYGADPDRPHTVADLLAAHDAAQARIAALEAALERVCDELEGTHEHLQDIIDGNVTGVLAPLVNYERLRRDLAEARRLDERVIADARKLLGGDA